MRMNMRARQTKEPMTAPAIFPPDNLVPVFGVEVSGVEVFGVEVFGVEVLEVEVLVVEVLVVEGGGMVIF
jgi:hypothetical protein